MNSSTGIVLPIDPPTGSGGRLFKLSGMTRERYEEAFERRNLLDQVKYWDRSEATIAGRGLVKQLKGREVVVLGQEVWRCLLLPKVQPLTLNISWAIRWWYVPHPSGLTRFYNDSENRKNVTRLLARLVHEHEDQAWEVRWSRSSRTG